MHPRCAYEEMCCFDLSVRSSSSGRDQSEGPPIVINCDRYNSFDGTSRLIESTPLKMLPRTP